MTLLASAVSAAVLLAAPGAGVGVVPLEPLSRREARQGALERCRGGRLRVRREVEALVLLVEVLLLLLLELFVVVVVVVVLLLLLLVVLGSWR